MKILGWNINGMRSTFTGEKSSLGKLNLESFFAAHDCDIYCFQETKASDWSKLSADLVSINGFDSFWDFSSRRKGWSGTVTFAKKGITKYAATGFGNQEFNDEGRCVMTDHEQFVLFNVYFPNGGTGEERLLYKYKYYDAFYHEMQKLLAANRKVIVTGDVNTAHKEIDIWNPKLFATSTGFLPREREWIDKILDLGFFDAFRKFYPDKEKSYTFWDMRTNKRPSNSGWRIDYFLVSNSLENHVSSSEILHDIHGSDHCPITLTLKIVLETGYPTPKNAGNLRSEFKNVSKVDIKSFFSKKLLKRPLEDESESPFQKR